MGKLSTTAVRAKRQPGRYSDGDGLYLVVSPAGTASWVARVQKDKRRRDIGLGSEKKVSLARARELAALVRGQIEAGLDPVAERRKVTSIPTFERAAGQFHAEQKRAWSNGKHQDQWLSSLRMYAFPTIGSLPVNAVDAAHVRDLLAEIWLTKNQTARRVRQRIAAVIDWSVGKGFREAPLLMNVVDRALPKMTQKGGHHAAMAYTDVPAFVASLRDKETWGRLCLEAAILTAARSGEIRHADWDEIDFENNLWKIPASRMKSKREHVVPLSEPAAAVFRRAQALSSRRSGYIFEGMKPDRPMSDMTLMKVIRDMRADCTAHGFRSSFRDWVAETTTYPGELAEAALAHVIPNKTEAAYRRGNLLERRRGLMSAWGDYCGGREAKVVQLVPAPVTLP